MASKDDATIFLYSSINKHGTIAPWMPGIVDCSPFRNMGISLWACSIINGCIQAWKDGRQMPKWYGRHWIFLRTDGSPTVAASTRHPLRHDFRNSPTTGLRRRVSSTEGRTRTLLFLRSSAIDRAITMFLKAAARFCGAVLRKNCLPSGK
jgi:hypothetical protein